MVGFQKSYPLTLTSFKLDNSLSGKEIRSSYDTPVKQNTNQLKENSVYWWICFIVTGLQIYSYFLIFKDSRVSTFPDMPWLHISLCG